MRRLAFIAAALLATLSSAPAQQYPTQWYWQVADSSPATQVWEATSGAFVSNTSAPFNAWILSTVGNTAVSSLAVCGAANNGVGITRLTVCNPLQGLGGWATGQIKTVTGVGGVPPANGAFAITVVDPIAGTIDLQGSIFSGAYTSGGAIGAGAPMDTAASMNAVINQYNLSQYNSPQNPYSGLGTTITATIALANVLKLYQPVNITSAGQIVTLPQANLFGSLPIGISMTFYNSSTQPWQLKDFSGGTVIAAVPVGFSVGVTLVGNATKAGTWQAIYAPTTVGVSCSGTPTAMFASVNGIVTHC